MRTKLLLILIVDGSGAGVNGWGGPDDASILKPVSLRTNGACERGCFVTLSSDVIKSVVFRRSNRAGNTV